VINSVFSSIYSYREKQSNNSKENYLIEIFAFCLKSDKIFLNNFLNQFALISDSEINIKTQSVYEQGRPDIEINIPSLKTCLLVECKIEHFERQNQLNDYKLILENKDLKNRCLVYLTKYYEFKINHNKKINLHCIKWSDIYEIINEDNRQITQQLKQYIKEENMAESKNFNYADLNVLKNITNTVSKMDEVLDNIKEYYESKIGKMSKDSARSTRIKDEWYGMYEGFGFNSTKFYFSIQIGFIWWDDEIWLANRIWISKAEKYKKTNEYLKKMKLILKNWDIEEYENNSLSIGIYKPIAQFIIEEDEQVPAMVNFLKTGVDQIEKFTKIDAKIFS
jgi:PD-(D/E)XK nuclease superfamily